MHVPMFVYNNVGHTHRHGDMRDEGQVGGSCKHAPSSCLRYHVCVYVFFIYSKRTHSMVREHILTSCEYSIFASISIVREHILW